MTKLYEIAKDYIGFLESDLPEDEMKDCLESIEGAFEEKANNIIAVNETLKSDVAAIDAQIKRLQERKKSIVGNQERLKEYLRYNMDASGLTKIKHPLFSVTLGEPSVTCSILDGSLLPKDYVKTVTASTPNKTAILKALKEGEEIPGAVLSTGKSRLIIK